MTKSIGEMLDSPVEFWNWMSGEAGRLGALLATAQLGLLDHIGPKPTTAADVAERCGLDPELIRRLVEYLAAEGVLDSDGEGRFSPTARSRFLQSNKALAQAGAWSYGGALHLPAAIERKVTAYEACFGRPVFEDFKAKPEWGRQFGECMSFSTAITEDCLFANHAFQPFTLAVDVGGSMGSLLLRLLEEHPSARGILFDLPETAEQARSAIAGSPSAKRVDIADGDFFQKVPAQGDLYLLKQILHDWSDEECTTILSNIRAAIVDGGRLAVIERVIPEDFTPHIAYDFDMVMMIWTTGRERRLSEFKKMFEATGFAFDRVTENPDGMGVIEAIAV
jgi:hypothetical protein